MEVLARYVLIELIDMSDTQLTLIGECLANIVKLSNALTLTNRIGLIALDFVELSVSRCLQYSFANSCRANGTEDIVDKLTNITKHKRPITAFRSVALNSLTKN